MTGYHRLAVDWKRKLRYDPIPALLSSVDEALRFWVDRDLAGLDAGPVERLWQLPEMLRILRVQQKNGSWKYRGGKPLLRSREDYDQIETYRILRLLVEKYGVNRELPAFEKAAECLFTHQTSEGDFRGICGRQYMPYYSAAMTELLVKGGYADDSRVESSFKWLLSVRQNDGGWAFPLRTVGLKLDPHTRSRTDQPDRTKPFSHLVTGMVLRAFAAHSKYKKTSEAWRAGKLLSERVFKPDHYPDRKSQSFWTSFSFPFWFTDLLSAMDTLTLLGFGSSNRGVSKGIEWFRNVQRDNGLWSLRLRIMAGENDPDRWITLAICRVFERLWKNQHGLSVG